MIIPIKGQEVWVNSNDPETMRLAHWMNRAWDRRVWTALPVFVAGCVIIFGVESELLPDSVIIACFALVLLGAAMTGLISMVERSLTRRLLADQEGNSLPLRDGRFQTLDQAAKAAGIDNLRELLIYRSKLTDKIMNTYANETIASKDSAAAAAQALVEAKQYYDKTEGDDIQLPEQ